ncbi:hypothetical protein QE152_g7472 [Popillia japonica]|uniref:Uncharacterized protein n=1 Tax=Popillia japonica TaxID=7064 RepID=A0AAW1MDP3_POPJA
MGVTSNTGLLPSKKTKFIQYLQKPPVHLRAIAVPAPYTLKPFAGLYNPFPYGCSLLCNHPADTEAKDLVKKAKETWAAEGKSLLLAEEVAAIRAGIEQFQAAQSDQQSDKNTSDNMDSVPEGLFRRYTETDSRPLTPAPTIASTYTRASASRRCVTPDPVITAQFKEKTRLILDLRRSHSQETLSWFGGASSTDPPIIRIQQAPTRSVTPESNLAAQKDPKKKSPRSLQQSPVCKKTKTDIPRPKTEFPRLRNDTKSELRPPKIHLEVTPPKESNTQEIQVVEAGEDDEDVMKRRGKKRHKKGRDSSRGPPVQQSIDPETQVATIGIDSHNPSARTSLIPNTEQEMDDAKAEEKRKSSLDVNSYLDKEILRQLRRELNEEIVDNEFDLKRKKALEEALKAVQVEKVTCDELKMLKQELKIPVINVEFWLSLPRTFSRSSARFELPMDSTTLSHLTPMDYIKESINITSSRRLLYNCIFNRHKIEYEEDEENQERIMSGKEIPAALGEMMGHPLSRSQLDWFQNLVGWSEDDTFDFKTFCGLCALCERLLAPEYYPQLPSKRLDPCHEIEVADFESLERRLRGQTPDERLKKILYAIKNS